MGVFTAGTKEQRCFLGDALRQIDDAAKRIDEKLKREAKKIAKESGCGVRIYDAYEIKRSYVFAVIDRLNAESLRRWGIPFNYL